MPIFAHMRPMQRLSGLIYFPLNHAFPHFGLRRRADVHAGEVQDPLPRADRHVRVPAGDGRGRGRDPGDRREIRARIQLELDEMLGRGARSGSAELARLRGNRAPRCRALRLDSSRMATGEANRRSPACWRASSLGPSLAGCGPRTTRTTPARRIAIEVTVGISRRRGEPPPARVGRPPRLRSRHSRRGVKQSDSPAGLDHDRQPDQLRQPHRRSRAQRRRPRHWSSPTAPTASRSTCRPATT